MTDAMSKAQARARRKAARAGKCVVCRRRRRTRGRPTCRTCRAGMRTYSGDRYAERRRQGLCYRCAAPAEGYLCEDCAELRRQRRRRAGQR